MSQRPDEQGFERFFADPPAALVVLKGLRTLAERRVLPGRDPVQAHRTSESVATKEEGAKNAEIEANDGESQTIVLQKDKASNPESEGEVRSQLRDQGSLGHG